MPDWVGVKGSAPGTFGDPRFPRPSTDRFIGLDHSLGRRKDLPLPGFLKRPNPSCLDGSRTYTMLNGDRQPAIMGSAAVGGHS